MISKEEYEILKKFNKNKFREIEGLSKEDVLVIVNILEDKGLLYNIVALPNGPIAMLTDLGKKAMEEYVNSTSL